MTRTHEFTISGYIVGQIWWPTGAECWKSLTYDLTREDSRFNEPGTLRDHILAITSDGDFQSCNIAQGKLIATRRVTRGDRRIVETRSFPLAMFPSVADCLHSDPDWWPDYGEGES